MIAAALGKSLSAIESNVADGVELRSFSVNADFASFPDLKPVDDLWGIYTDAAGAIMGIGAAKGRAFVASETI